MYFILGMVLLAVGLLMVIRPQVFYDLTESWKNSGAGEPSRMYLFSTRFGGVMCSAAGIAGIVVTFWR